MANKKYLTKEDKSKAIANNNKRYHKTFFGKLMLTYNNMNRRVRGMVKKHIYEGLELLDRDIFYEWAKNDEDYKRLFNSWVNSEYERKLSPSIDRIDSTKGYVLGNIRFITHSENSKLGNISKLLQGKTPSKLNKCQVREIKIALLNSYKGIIKDLSIKYNVSHAAISYIKSGKTWKHVKIEII
jgi:hypothetical protein